MDKKKKIWKEYIKSERGERLRSLSMRNFMGEELTQENDNEGRWKKYCPALLNSDEIREIGGHVRREMIGESN